ncbi:MAG: hypothetical protein L0K02_03120 [Corynebacterium sp.]|nr:hypothetical protein [Corynebacterium sp.]
MLDTSPRAAVDIAGDVMPEAVSRALSRFRHGPGAFAVHFAVEGGIPWTHLPSREAGTVHVGGSFEETAVAEREIHRGTMPEKPCGLVTQQAGADPTRARGGVHPGDTYAHVPAGFTGDATAAIIARIEEYAPGFRDRIVAKTVWNVRHIEDANPNYIEGDIVTGANSRANCCSARGSPSTRTAQGRAVSTCVPQPPRRVPEPTACAVTTRHCPR